jgi:hypothetical protein
VLRTLLLSFSVASWLAYVLPMAVGRIAAWQYPAAAAVAAAVAFALWAQARRRNAAWTFGRGVAPSLALLGGLVALFEVGAIPPVPVALRELVLCTQVNVRRESRRLAYELHVQPEAEERGWFARRRRIVGPRGTRAWAFARIFAPVAFADRVDFAWESWEREAGWTPRGSPVSLELVGGAEAGYRTFGFATLDRPGRYRLRVLTSDRRELGRSTFDFEEGEAPAPRVRLE